MKKQKKQQLTVLGLTVLLVAVLAGGILFVGAVSGWFDDPRVILDEEYYGDSTGFMELTADEYDELVKAGKSFIVLIDQSGCTTADRLRGYIKEYTNEMGVLIYRMMFAEIKNSPLHEVVKYYPSIALISKGNVVGYLRADSDDDASAYNDYDVFKRWMNERLWVVEKSGKKV